MDVGRTVQAMLDEALQAAQNGSTAANTPEAKAAMPVAFVPWRALYTPALTWPWTMRTSTKAIL